MQTSELLTQRGSRARRRIVYACCVLQTTGLVVASSEVSAQWWNQIETIPLAPVFEAPEAPMEPAVLPCIARLYELIGRRRPYVMFTLVGNRANAGNADYSTGFLGRTGSFGHGVYESGEEDWFFAAPYSCSRCIEAEPLQDSFGGCIPDQPFAVDNATQLHLSIRDTGRVELQSGDWSTHFDGQCSGDILWGNDGGELWAITFRQGPEVPK